MSRVTPSEVKEIISTTLGGTQLNPFITAANLTVTNKLVSLGLSASLLKEIERWLTAHYVSVYLNSVNSQGGLISRERVAGDTEIEYVTRKISGVANLTATSYGQQAIMLDYTGTLANLGKRKAIIKVIGAG